MGGSTWSRCADYPYPEKTPSGHVTRLEDRDGDGRFETRTIFVDGLSWPTGIVPYDDGVFIAVAPDILYAKDTDGDGVADVRKVLFTGFGTENVQGLFNGLLWGPDGWIYGVTSSNGGTIRNRSRPDDKPVSVRGRDFRFKPDGSAFEAISGGGQFGHSFDDWGHRFHLQQQQSCPPDRVAVRLPRAQPRLDPAAGHPRHRGRRAGGTGVSESARRSRGGSFARASVPPIPCYRSGSPRPSCSPRLFHFGDRRHHLPRLGLSAGVSRQRVRRRRRRQPGPSQDRLELDGATYPCRAGRREGRVPGVDRQLVPAGQLRQHARWNAA